MVKKEKDVVVVVDETQLEEKLLSDTSERLDKTFKPTPEIPADEPDESDDSTLVDKEKSADETDKTDKSTPKKTADEKDEVESKEEGDEKIADKKKEEIPPLSDAYYRAAIHRGWKDEDIKDLYKNNPELAIRTFGNIYEEVNRSSKDFAAIGRARKVEQAKVAAGTKVTSEVKPEFKGLDIEKIKKEYPDDPIVDVIIAQQEQNKLLFDTVNELKQTRSAPVMDQPPVITSDPEVAAIQQQIETFFGSDELKDYQDFYGVLEKDAENWDTLTPGQKMNRWTAIEMMDQMMAGASVLGRKMDMDEALRRAHLSVTEPIREKVIREGIKSQVIKRSKSITLKPSNTTQPEGGKPQSQDDLVERTEARLLKTFGKNK